MTKVRNVNYAGFSRAVNEKGEVSYGFHTSNNTKYAVWANLPTAEGRGYQVAFHWFKVPAGTEKLAAVKMLLGFDAVKADTDAVAMLNGVLAKAEPKVKVAKPRKAKVAKAKVTVTVKDKPEPKGIADIRAAAEAFKAARNRSAA